MTVAQEKISRRDQILQALAVMLENHPGDRITTAALAQKVGVTEAALYRHFPSKARMYEGLIEFAEESLFSRMRRIDEEGQGALVKASAILALILGFAERNPGISRILNGDALVGENVRLMARVNQIYDRIEAELRQIFRVAEQAEGLRLKNTSSISAQLLVTQAEGKISQFVRTGFKRRPTENWEPLSQLLPQILLG